MNTNIVIKDDMSYLTQQTKGQINLIISGMSALLSDTDNKVSMMENQQWYQRMCRTLLGKNKLTKNEIKKNYQKINTYVAQAMAGLYEQNCIDHQIMMSLGNQLNEIYAENLKIKDMLGEFIKKLNEKIESVDNFHMLNTEIEQGAYSNSAVIIELCKIISQIDKRCIKDSRKMNILKRTMINKGILNNSTTTLIDYLMNIIEIPISEVGNIYIELSTIRGNFMANIFLKIIEDYHFLSDIERKIKNKQTVVENIIIYEGLVPHSIISINDLYEDFINSKLNMIEGLLPNKSFQIDSNLLQAEKLFLLCMFDEAFNMFYKLAEDGNGRAMYFLGEYYLNQYGSVVQNNEEARKWFIKGREVGDALATLNLAYLLTEGDIERENIYTEVFELVLKLAENDDVIAQNELAELYAKGYGIPKSYEEAFFWFEKAAQNGHFSAMTELAECYFDGKYVEEDQQEAIKWICNSAEQGYDKAQCFLGALYMSGEGIDEDYAEAIKWFRKAAEQGNATAQYFLGALYISGEGVEKDDDEAVKWLLKAAEQGVAEAQYELGSWYMYGIGVDKDKSKAEKWFRKAVEQGDKIAIKNI